MFENIQNGLTHPLFIGVIVVGLIIYSSYGTDNNSDLESLDSSQTQGVKFRFKFFRYSVN